MVVFLILVWGLACFVFYRLYCKFVKQNPNHSISKRDNTTMSIVSSCIVLWPIVACIILVAFIVKIAYDTVDYTKG